MKKHNLWKWLLLAFIIIGIGFGFHSCTHKSKTSYLTSPLSKGNIIQKITASGIINPISIVNIGTQVSGTISEIFVDYNSLVKKGQLLAQIDPALFEATVAQRQASLDIAKAQVEVSKNDIIYYKKHLDRIKKLNSPFIIRIIY